jgi:hypothetical protein
MKSEERVDQSPLRRTAQLRIVVQGDGINGIMNEEKRTAHSTWNSFFCLVLQNRTGESRREKKEAAQAPSRKEGLPVAGRRMNGVRD